MNKTSLTSEEFSKISTAFNITGDLESLMLHKRGHIHDTYISTWEIDDLKKRYIHQKINQSVFQNVPGLIKNIELVTEHLQQKIGALSTTEDDCTLTLLRTIDGQSYYRDESDNWWRTYIYIENTFSIEVCQEVEQAEQAGSILGRFQRYLLDLDPSKLIETIPDFLSSPRRYAAFEDVVNKDNLKRVSTTTKEIEFVRRRSELIYVIQAGLDDGTIPLRVVHGDMKLNNALFSVSTRKAICLVDLDTCMPGYSLFDFGDLVRSTSVPTAEDEQDLSKVQINLDFFRAIVRGYLGRASFFLNERELELLPIIPRLLALTLGVRFLTDYLQGDTYFKIDRPLHNLERARTQFTVVERMEYLEKQMEMIVKEVSANYLA